MAISRSSGPHRNDVRASATAASASTPTYHHAAGLHRTPAVTVAPSHGRSPPSSARAPRTAACTTAPATPAHTPTATARPRHGATQAVAVARVNPMAATPSAEGCAVAVFPEAPSTPTENIGPVSATCDDFVSDEVCLRTLKDEACKLGGDVVWGVPAASQPVSGTTKKRFQGRAAHTAPAAR